MSSRKYSEERPRTHKSSTFYSDRDEKHSSDRHRDPRDMGFDAEDRGSYSRRNSNRDVGGRRYEEKNDRSVEQNNSKPPQNLAFSSSPAVTPIMSTNVAQSKSEGKYHSIFPSR